MIFKKKKKKTYTRDSLPTHSQVWPFQGLRKISPTPPAQLSLDRQGNEALLCKPINSKQLTLQKM